MRTVSFLLCGCCVLNGFAMDSSSSSKKETVIEMAPLMEMVRAQQENQKKFKHVEHLRVQTLEKLGAFSDEIVNAIADIVQGVQPNALNALTTQVGSAAVPRLCQDDHEKIQNAVKGIVEQTNQNLPHKAFAYTNTAGIIVTILVVLLPFILDLYKTIKPA